MIPKIQFKMMKPQLSIFRSVAVAKRKTSTFNCPLRNYIVYYKSTESDSEAAEANPVKHLYQEEIIQEMTEIQRMNEFSKSEPRVYYNIKGAFPEVVEEFYADRLLDKCTTKINEANQSDDVKLDQLNEEQARNIINEIHKNDKGAH